MPLIFVDVEARGPAPRVGCMTEFGAVICPDRQTFHGVILGADGKPLSSRAVVETDLPAGCVAIGADLRTVMVEFALWIGARARGRPVFLSDNPAYDWQWINDAFWVAVGANPFGHSGRRISDFYAGLQRNFRDTQSWKAYRVTPHDHHPVHDALGNVEAVERFCREHAVVLT